MIFYLEYRNDGQRLGLVGARSARWLSRSVRRGELAALAAARRQFGLARRRPQAVAAAIFPQGSPEVSWSTVRAVVAVGNALAFAWGVPAVGVNPTGLDEDALAKAIRTAVKRAEPEARLSARYSGEPNITVS
jgi:hypothetical protein